MPAGRRSRTIVGVLPTPHHAGALMRSLTRLAAAGAALVALALAAPAAHADSIAYVKDGDVWLSTSDGARQYQVTFTGRYADISQADDGTMIALTGVRLH